MEYTPVDAPTYKSMEIKDNKAIISFNNVGENAEAKATPNSFNGFTNEGTRRLEGFEIAGEDQIFYPANAGLLWGQNKIELSSENVPNPVAVRYAFINVPNGNVTTVLGLPLAPFRTDNWKIPASEVFK